MGYGAADSGDNKPSLKGPRARVDRAELHLRMFEAAWREAIDAKLYTFLHEVHADGLNHRYRAQAVPDLDVKWSLMVGDCVHNLRSALDHLACELVRAHGGRPGVRTRFPVHTVPGGVRVHGGITDDALRLIEEVQPYTDTDEGRRIRLIKRLDGADKHGQVLLAPGASAHSIIVPLSRPRPAPDIVKSWTSDRALESGKTVHGYTYISQYFGEDPNVKVTPHILIEDPVVEHHFGRISVPVLLGEKLIWWVREQFLPRFEPFLPPG